MGFVGLGRSAHLRDSLCGYSSHLASRTKEGENGCCCSSPKHYDGEMTPVPPENLIRGSATVIEMHNGALAKAALSKNANSMMKAAKEQKAGGN